MDRKSLAQFAIVVDNNSEREMHLFTVSSDHDEDDAKYYLP